MLIIYYSYSEVAQACVHLLRSIAERSNQPHDTVQISRTRVHRDAARGAASEIVVDGEDRQITIARARNSPLKNP